MRSVPGSERGPEPAFSKESAEDFQKRKFLQRFCWNLKKRDFLLQGILWNLSKLIFSPRNPMKHLRAAFPKESAETFQNLSFDFGKLPYSLSAPAICIIWTFCNCLAICIIWTFCNCLAISWRLTCMIVIYLWHLHWSSQPPLLYQNTVVKIGHFVSYCVYSSRANVGIKIQ